MTEERKDRLAREFDLNRYEETPTNTEWAMMNKLSEISAQLGRVRYLTNLQHADRIESRPPSNEQEPAPKTE
jgi:predicted transcriptional regulator